MKNTIAAVGILSLMLISAQFVLAEGDCGSKVESRIYSGHVARWLEIDPLADKYPNVSPYVYCDDNPLMYVDPYGEKLRFAQGVSEEFKAKFAMVIKFLNEHGTSGIIARIEAMDETVYISETNDVAISDQFNANECTIYWDPHKGMLTTNGVYLSPATLLVHESDHALQYLENPAKFLQDLQHDEANPYDNAEEQRVITGSEQTTALKHGEISGNLSTRDNHTCRKEYTTISPISTKWYEEE